LSGKPLDLSKTPKLNKNSKIFKALDELFTGNNKVTMLCFKDSNSED